MSPLASTPEEAVREIALTALHPNKTVTPQLVRESGLHREMLQGIYDSLKPELASLAGWKPLKEFGYTPYWREHSSEDRKQGEKLTKTWLTRLVEAEAGLGDVLAINIYDGEIRPAPARDYRLFLLKDGRLLHYAGGFHTSSWQQKPVSVGVPMDMLNTLEDLYPAHYGHDKEPFVLLAQCLLKLLDETATKREAKAAKQRRLHKRIVKRLSKIGVGPN